MNYKGKYIKYKSKNTNLIIHISGPSGSGKTTLGHKLQEKFGNKIIVKDIDNLRTEFIEEYYGDKTWTMIDKNAYQQYIDDYINKQNKPLVFVGLNNMPWWHKDLYYNLHSKYNFYIEIDDETIIKQKCLRLFKDLENDEMAMKDLINNNNKFIKLVNNAVKQECGAKNTIKDNNKWAKDYKKQGYKFMLRDDILKEVSKILNNI